MSFVSFDDREALCERHTRDQTVMNMSGFTQNDDDDDDAYLSRALFRASLSAAVRNAAVDRVSRATRDAGKTGSTALAAFGVCVSMSILGRRSLRVAGRRRVGASVATREGKAVVRRHVRGVLCVRFAGIAAGGALLLSRDTLFFGRWRSLKPDEAVRV